MSKLHTDSAECGYMDGNGGQSAECTRAEELKAPIPQRCGEDVSLSPEG